MITDDGTILIWGLVCAGLALVISVNVVMLMIQRAIRKRRRDRDLEALKQTIREAMSDR